MICRWTLFDPNRKRSDLHWSRRMTNPSRYVFKMQIGDCSFMIFCTYSIVLWYKGRKPSKRRETSQEWSVGEFVRIGKKKRWSCIEYCSLSSYLFQYNNINFNHEWNRIIIRNVHTKDEDMSLDLPLTILESISIPNL